MVSFTYCRPNRICVLGSQSELIPKRPTEGCPVNTNGCSGNDCNMPQSCFCEEHCSWETCRLADSPEKCLKGLNSFWSWDTKKLFWVAQIDGMIKTFTHLFYLRYSKIRISLFNICHIMAVTM